MVVNIYDYLIEGNKKYGSNEEDVCRSIFKCNPHEIQENVITAPAVFNNIWP